MTRLHAAILCAAVASLSACNKSDCLAGSVVCDGTCVRLSTDGANCGACGNDCAAGTVCSNGACAATCASPLATCEPGGLAYCADTANDPTHCGTCGASCPAGQLCSGGVCAPTCIAPLATCGTGAAAFCANLANDPANCGACAHACSPDAVCDRGECAVTCTGAGSLLCDDRCVDVATDVANCGACGNACAAGSTCVAATCAPTCPVGQVRCGGRCVDLASDQVNCGGCGEVCPDFGVCTAGACAAVSCRGEIGLPGVPDVVGPRTFTLAPVDFDRDGALDLIVAPVGLYDLQDGTLQVLRNLGERRFAPSASFSAGISVGRVRVGDVNGDGHSDLVATGGGKVTVLRGAATGGFAPPTSPVAVSGNVSDLALADLNGDGRSDLVLTAGQLQVRSGSPAGTFGPPTIYSNLFGTSLFFPRSIAVGDMNGDGFPDVVGADDQGQKVGVFLNDFGGTLSPASLYAPNVVIGPALALADVDDDGDLDLLGAGYDSLVVFLNAGDGTLEPPVSYVTGFGNETLAVGDFDDDGHPDVAVSNWSWDAPRGIYVFRNAGDGTFLPPELYFDMGAAQIVPADLDGDGRTDLALASSAGLGTHLLWNDGGAFLQPAFSAAPITFNTLELGDLDGDGRTDIAGFEYPTGIGSILLGDGAGGFAPGPSFEGAAIALGDLDGDGDADLVAGTSSLASEPSLRSYRMEAGALVLAQELAAPEPMALADVDGDGKLDVIGFRPLMGEDDQVTWLPGRGDGTFGEVRTLGLVDGSGLQALATGDIDGNGWIDVVGAGYRELLVWRTLGGGSFAFTRVPMAETASHLAPGDLDGDGNLDVAYSNSTSVGVLLGAGDGTFVESTPLAYAYNSGIRIGAPGGRDRNVLFVHGNATIGIVEVDAGGGLALVGRWSSAGGSWSLAVGDVDGDLRPDVVMGGYRMVGVRSAVCLP